MYGNKRKGIADMKYAELLGQVKKELQQDKINLAKAIIKERLYEIEETEKALTALKTQLKDQLAKTI